MMKQIVSLFFIMLLTGYAYSDINQKVRTKEVEIINTKVNTKELEVINRKVTTKEINIPGQHNGIEPTIIEPASTENDSSSFVNNESPVIPPENDDQELIPGHQNNTADSATTEKPALQLGARIGATAPGTGLAVDLTFLPINMGNNNTLYTRIGLVSEQNSKYSLLALHINEHYHIPLGGTFEGYGGLGLNLPLSSGNADSTGTGINFVLGIEDSIDFIADKSERIFLETGINSVSINDKSNSVFNLLGGYKILF